MDCLKILPCLVFLFKVLETTNAQLVSPCPRLFVYEPNTAENDRWYGQLTLLSESELSGVWLRIILDKVSVQLGNWFGEVVTTDNKEYLIKNPRHKLSANTPYVLRFYIKYNPAEPPPQLTAFRLNARTVCPEGGGTTIPPTTIGQLITSSELSTTSAPFPSSGGGGGGGGGSFGGSGGGFSRPTNGGFRPGTSSSTDDDDYFQGDWVNLFRPRPQGGGGGQGNMFEVACGTVIKQPRPLITHGQATHEGEFPWHAALYHSKGIDLTYICGASLISRYHVLTVAHCVTRRKNHSPLNPDNLVIYLGKYYLKRWSSASIQDRHVEKIIPHPKYNSQSYSNDIAVLKLAEAAEITDFVRPICLWEENTNLEAVIQKQGTVVGWGFDETGRVTEQLTKAHMPVVTQETCIYSFPDFYSRFTSSTTFCAGFKNGTSVCNGDSGGGIVFPKAGSNPQNPVWQIRGMVSISVALQNQFKCDSSHYVVFTDVAKYLDWIKANMV